MSKKPSSVSVKRRKRLKEGRIEELLDIAAEVFIADGFAAASTNKIARLANASKTTFYSRFPTKEALFLAVIERRVSRIFEQVAKFPEGSSLEITLKQFGANLLKFALSPEEISLIRMVSMESERHPELAKSFYENGPGRREDALAGYLAEQVKAGSLRNEHPMVMAGHLMSLLTGSAVRWSILGFKTKALSGPSLTRHIQSVVDLFLRAYGRS